MAEKNIYNKNAREKALLEEAYSQVHNEVAPAAGLVARSLPAIGRGLRSIGGAAATGAREGAKGAAKQAGAAAGAAAVNKVAGKFGAQQPAPPAEDEGAVDVELDHWWDFDEEDVVMKVYHGALHTLPPPQGTPEYERNYEKIFTWLKGKYPKPDDYNIDEVEFQSRTTDDATEWANRVSRDPESRFYDPKHDEDAESREERADVDKYEYEQGKEAGEREDHDKGVKMAHEALEMFKDELHVGGHGEDINVNELADAHDQLSRALHFLFDETDVEYITGGRATQRSEAQSQPEQFGAIGEFPE